MEEILASIRRIIADDQDVPAAGAEAKEPSAPPPRQAAPVEAPPPNDILDLAELNKPEPAAALPEPVPEPDPELEPAPLQREVSDVSFRDAALSGEPSAASLDSLLAPQPEPPAAPARPVPILEEIPKAPPPPPPEPEPFVPPPPAPPPLPAAVGGESLVSTEARASVGNAFHMLSHTVLTQNARTLEDLVTDMLKPMLKAWLDENLPTTVERLVRAEIERVVRGGR